MDRSIRSASLQAARLAIFLVPTGAHAAAPPPPPAAPEIRAAQGEVLTTSSDGDLFTLTPDEYKKKIGPIRPPGSDAPEPLPQPTVAAHEVVLGPLIDSLDGMPYVNAGRQSGKARPVKAGELLEVGEAFETGPEGQLRLAFESGVQVLVGASTSIAIVPDDSPETYKTGALYLDAGEVRVLVPGGADSAESTADAPTDAEEGVPGLGPKKFRFTVRTRAATMGVRGTDFVVRTDSEKTSVFGVSGQVEVASDTASLAAGRGVLVPPEFFTDAFGRSKSVNKARVFAVGAMLKDFHGRNHKLEGHWRAARLERKSPRLRERFRGVRQRRIDSIGLKRGIIPSHLREGMRMPRAGERQDEDGADGTLGEKKGKKGKKGRRNKKDGRRRWSRDE